MKNDDESWLDGLAGLHNDSADARDGQRLRRAMQKRTVAETSEPLSSTVREAELIARASRAAEDVGATRPRRERGKPRFIDWILGTGGMVALASVVVLAVAVGFYMSMPQEEALRGSSLPELRIVADDPQALRIAITEALLDAGIDVEGVSILGDEFVAADLPQPLTDDIKRILAEFDLPEPASGELRVRISNREQ